MRCEECLPRIEAYVDGELEGRMIAPLTAHIAICSTCASELEELRREQAIYAHYQRDVEVTPAQWNIVRARIEREKDAGLQRAGAGFRRRLARALGPLKQFRPRLVAALVLIAICVTAGMLYFNSQSGHGDLASKSPSADQTSPPSAVREAGAPVKANDNDVSVASNKPSQNNRSDGQAAPRTGTSGRERRPANTLRSANRRIKGLTPEGIEQVDVNAADNTASVARRSAAKATGDFDLEVARHAERAELLLRSFRNVRLSSSNRRLEVSYEKDQSRKLLYKNIALRREAVSRGDELTAELLNGLEPILLDIANLANRARSRDVYSIEQSMEKKEIVATLQVRTLVASNKFD